MVGTPPNRRSAQVIRAKTHFEKVRSGRNAIVATELPYLVTKSELLAKTADAINARRIEGIADLRDESGREGTRVVFELKRDAQAEIVLSNLFKSTRLQTSFPANIVAVDHALNDDGDDVRSPVRMTLRYALERWLGFRFDCVRLRAAHSERRAAARLHIVEGYLKALDFIDEVIAIIRGSANVGEARERLIARFEFTTVQADAILEMRLQRLTGMERQKLLDEQGELNVRIERYREILGDEIVLMGVVKTELLEIRESYSDERRTRFVAASADLDKRDLVASEDQVVTVSHLGYIKRTNPDEWRMQRRGGSGKRGMSTRDEDFVTSLFVANTHDLLLVFSNEGRVFPLHVYDVAKLSGSEISTRLGRHGVNGDEHLIALDGKTYELTPEMCVIADANGERPIGLGGVMGGESTGCSDDTVDVFIESAWFEPIRIAQTGRTTGIASDAQYRFARTVDTGSLVDGIELATKLILELCGGSIYIVSLYLKDLEAQRRDELGVDFETWIAAGGYFPPFA